VGGVWDVFTNTHHSELAAQNDLFQKRRSGSAFINDLRMKFRSFIISILDATTQCGVEAMP
jgi:hypothetical protein